MEEEGNENKLIIKNVSKNYGIFKALDDINLELERGKVYCLLGHNGAGKSTLVNILIGIENLSEGQIQYFGNNDFLKNSKSQIGVCTS